jgi:hypothetical protein
MRRCSLIAFSLLLLAACARDPFPMAEDEAAVVDRLGRDDAVRIDHMGRNSDGDLIVSTQQGDVMVDYRIRRLESGDLELQRLPVITKGGHRPTVIRSGALVGTESR